jgi:hypothetical protein
MGLAQYFLTHEENMRQSFSQPSRRARRTLPDGTCIDYIMNDVVDCIMISRPQGLIETVSEEMTTVLEGYYIKCHAPDGKEKYGHLVFSPYGELLSGMIDELFDYSPKMLPYREVELEHEQIEVLGWESKLCDMSTTITTVTTVVDTDTGWYWTGGAHNTEIDGVTIPISHHERVAEVGSYTTTTTNIIWSFEGVTQYSEDSVVVTGGYTRTVEGKWINVVTRETVYVDEGSPEVTYIDMSSTNGVQPPYPGHYVSVGGVHTGEFIDSVAWTYGDLYYSEMDDYSEILSAWNDKMMLSSQLALRTDGKELLFVDSVSFEIAFRDMPGGEELTRVYMGNPQIVDNVDYQWDFSYANIFCVPSDDETP